MSKPVLFSLLSAFLVGAPLFGAERDNRLEVVAEEIESGETEVLSRNEVLVYYQDRVIKAEKARYNKETKMLYLEGPVQIVDDQGNKTQSESVTIDTEHETLFFKEILLFSKSDLWVLSREGVKKEEVLHLEESYFSSCDINDPLWTIYFDSSKYYTEDQYLKLYHARVYFGHFPIFYTPYLAFSTDNTRRSGLLFPMLGYTKNEGMIYEQPVYWAISPGMDMEFNPQVRTKRGQGLYTTYRFVNSESSSGSIKTGYFGDTVSYQQAQGNTERDYYGLQIKYDNDRLFFEGADKGEDGLYLSVNYMNDIEYQNLQKSDLGLYQQTPLQESKLNYYYQNESYYSGLTMKYFIDTRKTDNDDTLQLLPSLQWHKYLDRLFSDTRFSGTRFLDALLYSIDMQYNRYYRNEGVNVGYYTADIPLVWQESLFDDYLQLSVAQELHYANYHFSNATLTEEAFTYADYQHSVELSGALTKPYENFTHTVQPSLSYLIPGKSHEEPVNYTLLGSEQQALFYEGLQEKQIEAGLTHYFYNSHGNLIFSQRIAQVYTPQGEDQYQALHHEMEYRYGIFSLYSDLYYSHTFKKVSQASNRVSLFGQQYSASLGHTHKKQLVEGQDEVILFDDLNANLSYRWGEGYDLSAGMLYSLKDHQAKLWTVGIGYAKDCWSLRFDLREDLRPVTGGSERETRGYLQFEFRPFGGFRTGARL